MNEHGDYIPSKEADFIDWLDNFVEKLQINGSKWQIPQEEITEVVNLAADFKAKHTKCAGPDRTRTLVEEKDEAMAAVKARVRAMVQFRFANPAISDAERISAGLHPRDRTRTHIGEPNTRCLITGLKPMGGFRVEIRFQNEATPDSRAIPYGCNGAMLYYAFGPEKITDYKLLVHDKLMTDNPFMLQLPPEAEGMFLSAACCWQNNKGDLGRWSEIAHIAVS